MVHIVSQSNGGPVCHQVKRSARKRMPYCIKDVDHDGLLYFLREARKMDYTDAIGVLEQELAANRRYERAWNWAQNIYHERVRNHPYHNWNRMEQECYLAIMCYTLRNPNIGQSLNAFLRRAFPEFEIWEAFPYKSLWFFLLRAFARLPPFGGEPLYKGVHMFYVGEDDTTRFANFVSASTSAHVADRFVPHDGYRLEFCAVPSALVRDISMYSVFEHHDEVIIWPFCSFNVTYMDDDTATLEFESAYPGVGRRRTTRWC